MASSFTKLFSSITESTIWGEPYPVRLVWVTMLAMADQNGFVGASVPGLARRANVRQDEVELALAAFESPDPHSRTTDFEGRRISRGDGGWFLLNYSKYREMSNRESIRESKRKYMERTRAKNKKVETSGKSGTPWTQAEAEAEAEAEADKTSGKPPEVFAAPLKTETDTKKNNTWGEFPAWVEKQYARHPKKKEKVLAEQALASYFGKANDEAREAFEKVHAAWCATDAWRRNSGQFAPTLAAWIRDDGHLSIPIAEDRRSAAQKSMDELMAEEG